MYGLKAHIPTTELAAIDKHFDKANRRHPAWPVIHADDSTVNYDRSPKDYLTNQAVDAIAADSTKTKWLEETIERVVRLDDYEESASALTELRCYGALLECDFLVTPIPTLKTPTPDFQIELGGLKGFVEVAAKMEDDAQTDISKQLAAGDLPDGAERTFLDGTGFRAVLTAHARHPFGAPDPDKPGDTTQTNAISRICAIKQKETQLNPATYNILWIDFRDLGAWPDVLPPQSTNALEALHGTLTSGPAWYAFYGWKGAPVFETGHAFNQIVTPMAHFGRFHPSNARASSYAAAVMCFGQGTVLIENPACKAKPLPDDVRFALLNLPYLDLGQSVADWHAGAVVNEIDSKRKTIDALAARVKGSGP